MQYYEKANILWTHKSPILFVKILLVPVGTAHDRYVNFLTDYHILLVCLYDIYMSLLKRTDNIH